MGGQAFEKRKLRVARIGSTARKHELAGHEGEVSAPLAKKKPRFLAASVNQDERSGVARAQAPWHHGKRAVFQRIERVAFQADNHLSCP